MDDACAILRQRPAYFSAMRAAERNGACRHVQMARSIRNRNIGSAHAASVCAGGDPDGAAIRIGYSQALDGTWAEYQKEQRRHGAKRDRIGDATDGWYMSEQRQTGSARRCRGNTWPITGRIRANQFHPEKPWLVDAAAAIGGGRMYAEQLSWLPPLGKF